MTPNLQFFIGADDLTGFQQNLLQHEFVAMFDNVDDKYYATVLFEDKLKLSISKVTPEYFSLFGFSCSKSQKMYYNLSVKDDQEFFIATFGLLDELIAICKYYGFDYEYQNAGCAM